MFGVVFANYGPQSTPAAQPYNWHMGPWMMGFWGGPTGGWLTGFWIWSILSWLTWILIIVALVAFIRWMWRKGDKP